MDSGRAGRQTGLRTMVVFLKCAARRKCREAPLFGPNGGSASLKRAKGGNVVSGRPKTAAQIRAAGIRHDPATRRAKCCRSVGEFRRGLASETVPAAFNIWSTGNLNGITRPARLITLGQSAYRPPEQPFGLGQITSKTMTFRFAGDILSSTGVRASRAAGQRPNSATTFHRRQR